MRIVVKNVKKEIKKAEILKNIDFTWTGGHIYGLRGHNGSGKTMLLRLLCGLILPTEGSVFINEKELGKGLSFPEHVGVLIENPSFLSEYTGKENLQLLASIQNRIGEQEIEKMLYEVGLDPHDKRKYRKYSLGMKQRLGIACALMEEPPLILLDEPFNALDEEGIAQIRQLLLDRKNEQTLIVIACHDKELLESLADEIYCMKNGTLQKESL